MTNNGDAEKGAEHTTGARKSTLEKHQKGRSRKSLDLGGERGDARRRELRTKPLGWKGPWPPVVNMKQQYVIQVAYNWDGASSIAATIEDWARDSKSVQKLKIVEGQEDHSRYTNFLFVAGEPEHMLRLFRSTLRDSIRRMSEATRKQPTRESSLIVLALGAHGSAFYDELWNYSTNRQNIEN